MQSILEKFKNLDKNHKTNIVLIVIVVLVLLGSVMAYNAFFVSHVSGPVQEVDLPFDPIGPYALLIPRGDGNAATLDITRVGEYDAISYDLEYQSAGIDRGVHGDVKKLGQGGKQSEYTQEILFGTCSQGYTTAGPHCVFDPGVENGTLTLHIQKGNSAYRMITVWHLQKPDVSLGVLTSGDGHFIYTSNAPREQLAQLGYTIINDLSGAPKLPSDRTINGKVYALNIPQARSMPGAASVEIDVASAPPAGSQIGKYNPSAGNWELLQSKNATQSAGLSASLSGPGIFAILSPSQSK